MSTTHGSIERKPPRANTRRPKSRKKKREKSRSFIIRLWKSKDVSRANGWLDLAARVSVVYTLAHRPIEVLLEYIWHTIQALLRYL